MATKPIIAFFLLLLPMVIVTASVQQDNKNFMYKVSEGDFFLKKGMFDNAIEAYDEAINISPNSSVVLQKKGDALYGQGRYDEAAKAYEKAIEFDPRITKPSIWQHIDELLNIVFNITYLTYHTGIWESTFELKRGLPSYQRSYL